MKKVANISWLHKYMSQFTNSEKWRVYVHTPKEYRTFDNFYVHCPVSAELEAFMAYIKWRDENES